MHPVLPLMITASTNAGDPADFGFMGFVGILGWLLTIIAFWPVFKKAGKPGWAAIIPIYNIYVLLKIAGRPGWWLLLYLIPIVNWVVTIVVAIDVAKAFGKSTLFGVIGLWLFSIIGYLILGYGDATYHGSAADGQTTIASV